MLDRRQEHSFLLCCVRTFLKLESSDKLVAMVRNSIDWEYLIQTSEKHGLMPFLYITCKDIYPANMNDMVKEKLYNKYCANRQRNLLLTGELIRLQHLFQSNEISTVPFKGPALSAIVYKDLSYRQITDLDFLIRKNDVLRVKDLLMSNGYVPTQNLTSNQIGTLLKHEYEISFIGKNNKFYIDVHWELVPYYFGRTVFSESFWNSVRQRGQTYEIPEMPVEYLLLFLCVHATKHLWTKLIWVCDIAKAILFYKVINWGDIIVLAEKLGYQRMLFVGLCLAEDLLYVPLPREVRQRIADPITKKVVRKITLKLFEDNDDLSGLEMLGFYLTLNDSLKEQLKYCMRTIIGVNSSDITALSLPPSLFPLYYIVRPVRLLSKYLLKLKMF
jgi:hypothetical protein